jgi:hypothetical protein
MSDVLDTYSTLILLRRIRNVSNIQLSQTDLFALKKYFKCRTWKKAATIRIPIYTTDVAYVWVSQLKVEIQCIVFLNNTAPLTWIIGNHMAAWFIDTVCSW